MRSSFGNVPILESVDEAVGRAIDLPNETSVRARYVFDGAAARVRSKDLTLAYATDFTCE